MFDLHQMRVAVIATDGFEQIELEAPVRVLQQAGATVDVISDHAGEIQGFHHHDKGAKIKVDRTLDQVRPTEYDALLLPGGALNADTIRMNPQARQFVYEMDRARQPIAAICHAPWVLISAGVVLGRTLTSWPTIQDDLTNAGGRWEDREVVVDANFITSRGPKDIPAFNREMLKAFSRIPAEARL
jgi:protease I